MQSNRDYMTENLNLKQQIIALKNANKDKAEHISALKKEILEYNQLRERYKLLQQENENLKKQIKQLKEKNRETIFDEEFFRTLGEIE